MNTESFGLGLVKILKTNNVKVMGDQMQEDEMFGGEWKKEMNQYNKAAILESFAVIGTKAEHSRQLLGKTARVLGYAKITMLAYMQSEPISDKTNQEFESEINELEELQIEIKKHLNLS